MVPHSQGQSYEAEECLLFCSQGAEEALPLGPAVVSLTCHQRDLCPGILSGGTREGASKLAAGKRGSPRLDSTSGALCSVS